MTPVDMTNVSFVLEPTLFCPEGSSNASVARTMAHASSKPSTPVTAFAHPLFTTMALAFPPDFPNTSSDTITGAALNAFLVKHAAAEAGCFDVERISARARGGLSGVLFFLTPTWSPVRR